MSLKLTSPAFQHGGRIPEKYSRAGGNISPPLSWTGVPEDTESLALIFEDTDAPKGIFVHWLVYGIPPRTAALSENLQPSHAGLGGIHHGLNDFGEIGYAGPQPPSGTTHHYVFHLCALDTNTDIPDGLTREELEGAIEGHVLDEARLVGTFSAERNASR